ncbi:MAG: AtpZ/AtpI family protein [Lachnospiraceae bacterium]|nr:AtpZ/AtpI family protein [Lachnospiraceae bacterium]
MGKKIIRSFTMVTQISVCMMVPIFLCVWIGVWLNRLFHTDIAFVIMLVVGIGAAFRNVYIITKSFYMTDMRKEHEQLEYLQSLRNYRKEHPEEYEKGETDVTGDDLRSSGMDSDDSIDISDRK